MCSRFCVQPTVCSCMCSFIFSPILSTCRHPAPPVPCCFLMAFRPIPMRIRFRVLDSGQVAKTNVVRASRNWLLARNRMRKCCVGHLHVCSCDSAVIVLDSENGSQLRLLLLCLAPCRVHFARPWTQASKPALTFLVWLRRHVPRRFR